MAARPVPPALWAVIIVAIVAGGAGGAALWYHNRPVSAPSELTVVQGDNVTVDYIGIFGSGPEAGKVFDTSYYSVAVDNASFPKALQFHLRGGAKNYSALPVFVGANAPSSGYTRGNLTYISVVPGFWQGLIGLAGNSTRSVVVPPALGYGPTNAACVATRSLAQSLPVVESMGLTQFSARYPGVTASAGATFTEPHYLWPVLILSVNASGVTVENLASVGDTAHPAGWPVVVTSVTSTPNGTGSIALYNELSPSDAGHRQGFDFLGNGPCSAQARGTFIVTGVDPVHGTYTEDFNQEVQGETLIFIVNVLDIFPSTTVVV
jgi:FKBP-type peptidyl-prolyl cis-trans isomerase 2